MRPFHSSPIVDPFFLWHAVPAYDLMEIGAIPWQKIKPGSVADAVFSEFMLGGADGRGVEIISMFNNVNNADVNEVVSKSNVDAIQRITLMVALLRAKGIKTPVQSTEIDPEPITKR
jgi:hypothetical protein